MSTNIKSNQNVESEALGTPAIGGRPDIVWLSAILLLGFALRLINLGAKPFWHDEVCNLLKVENVADVVLYGKYTSNDPPLFTILGSLWRALGLFANEWTVRSLPAALGVGGIAAVYFAGRMLVDRRTGLIAAFILAVSPFHVVHSQDFKDYILLPLTGTLAAALLYRASESNRARDWTCYAAAAAAACYSAPFAAPLLISINVWFLLQLSGRRDRIPGWIAANTAAVISFLPWFGIMWRRFDAMILDSPVWWIPRPTPLSLAFYGKTLSFGYSGLDPAFKIALGVYCLAVAVGAIVAWKTNRRAALLLLVWFAAPILLTYVFSQFRQSIFLIRALLPFAAPFYLLAAAGISRIPCGRSSVLALMAIAAMAAPPLLEHYQDIYPPREFPHRPGIHPRVDYPAAANAIREGWQDGDIVLHSSISSWMPMYYYGNRAWPQFTVGVDSGFIDYINTGNPPTPGGKDDFPGYFLSNVQETTRDRNRVWFVFAEWEREYLPNNPMNVWRWLDAHYLEMSHHVFEDIEVFEYALPSFESRVVAQLEDRGAASRIVHANSPGKVYEKIRPDSGLAARPVDDRAGRIVATLADNIDAPDNILELGPAGASAAAAGVTLKNLSGDAVRLRIEAVASDALLDFSRLYEVEPQSDIWRYTSLYNPEPPPETWPLTSLAAEVSEAGQAKVVGNARLEPGTYGLAARILGEPGDAATVRASLHLNIASIEIDMSESGGGSEPAGNRWHWRVLRPITISESTAETPVTLTVRGVTGAQMAYANLESLVFARDEAPVIETRILELEAGQISTWRVSPPADARRLDLWIFEEGVNGHAYRLYKELPAR